jgi:hypothetical protein
MSKSESEASKASDRRELPLEESFSSGSFTENIRHRSGVGAIGGGNP